MNELLAKGLDYIKSKSPLVHAIVVAAAVIVLNLIGGVELSELLDVDQLQAMFGEWLIAFIFNARTKRHIDEDTNGDTGAPLNMKSGKDFDD